MSFLKKGVDMNTSGFVKDGKETVKETVKQCVEEGQKVVHEVTDKGCQAAKEAGDKAVDHLKTGIKFK